MARHVTRAATAAREIRKAIKAMGYKARVTSKTYSMGDSVNVRMAGETAEVVAKVTEMAKAHQMGSYNGREDIYEYSNTSSNVTQVKYVFVDNRG